MKPPAPAYRSLDFAVQSLQGAESTIHNIPLPRLPQRISEYTMRYFQVSVAHIFPQVRWPPPRFPRRPSGCPSTATGPTITWFAAMLQRHSSAP